MNLLDFNRTVPYKKRKGILGYFQLIYHNFFDLLLLNFIFLITCIPVFTIGPAYMALVKTCEKDVKDIPSYPLKDYFHYFKKYFSRTVFAGLLYNLSFFIIGFSFIFYFRNSAIFLPFLFFSAISLCCLMIMIMGLCYFYPYLSDDKLSFKEVLVKSFLTIFSKFKKSLFFLVFFIVSFLLVFAFFPYSLPIILIFPFTFIALLSAYLSN